MLEVKVLAVNLEARKIDLGVVTTLQSGKGVPKKSLVTNNGKAQKGHSGKKGRAVADPTQRPGKTKAGRSGSKPAAKSGGKAGASGTKKAPRRGK